MHILVSSNYLTLNLLGFTGSFCEISSIVTVTQATTTVGTTTAAVALCANQNTCQNLGVCYLISGVTRCVCPQGIRRVNFWNQTFKIF